MRPDTRGSKKGDQLIAFFLVIFLSEHLDEQFIFLMGVFSV
ncbi:hypothetical protein D521_0938 [beta proteobacterium CB]|nr:hypothetical protein D521_0938 [beta proteobacterium CB]